MKCGRQLGCECICMHLQIGSFPLRPCIGFVFSCHCSPTGALPPSMCRLHVPVVLLAFARQAHQKTNLFCCRLLVLHFLSGPSPSVFHGTNAYLICLSVCLFCFCVQASAAFACFSPPHPPPPLLISLIADCLPFDSWMLLCDLLCLHALAAFVFQGLFCEVCYPDLPNNSTTEIACIFTQNPWNQGEAWNIACASDKRSSCEVMRKDAIDCLMSLWSLI